MEITIEQIVETLDNLKQFCYENDDEKYNITNKVRAALACDLLDQKGGFFIDF